MITNDLLIDIGVFVGAMVLHAFFSHGGDMGEAYECDRRQQLEWANFEFNAFIVILWTGIALYLCWCLWKGFGALQPPAHHEVATPIATAAKPALIARHKAAAKAVKPAPHTVHKSSRVAKTS